MDYLCGRISFNIDYSDLSKPFISNDDILTGEVFEKVNKLCDDNKKTLLTILNLLINTEQKKD